MTGRVFCLMSALVCLGLAIGPARDCGAGSARSGPAVTRPVVTSGMQQQKGMNNRAPAADGSRTGKAFSGPAAPSPPAGHAVGGSGRKKAAHSSAPQSRGFSSNPFALEHRNPGGGEQGKKPEIRYGVKGERKEKPAVEAGGITLSGKKNSIPDNRLVPYRSTFSGGPQTLSGMDHDPAPEVNMSYRVDDKTVAKATINPQDSASPLYRPAETDGAINAAGVYIHRDIQPDLRLQIGGEYSEISRYNAEQDSSAGAAVGLRWSF